MEYYHNPGKALEIEVAGERYLRHGIRTHFVEVGEESTRYRAPIRLTEKGYAAKGAVTPSFHAEHAGLAFDICKNEVGHEYDDPAFFARVGEIGKMIGFSWGGDWGKFPDRPHFQWDAGGSYTSAMIRAKRYPPPMPRYEEEEMTQQQFDAMMENYLKRLAQQTPASWSAEARAWAEKNGLIAGDEAGNKQYRSFLTREQMAVLMQRYDAMQRGK